MVVFNNTSVICSSWSSIRRYQTAQSGMEQGIHLGRGELGHSLGSLRHGVLGKLTWEHQAHGGLDLAGGQGWLLVHAGQLQHTFTTRIVRVGQSGAGPIPSSPSRSTPTTTQTHLSGLGGNLLKLVGDEGVQDGHGLGADAGVGVHLLEHLTE